MLIFFGKLLFHSLQDGDCIHKVNLISILLKHIILPKFEKTCVTI